MVGPLKRNISLRLPLFSGHFTGYQTKFNQCVIFSINMITNWTLIPYAYQESVPDPCSHPDHMEHIRTEKTILLNKGEQNIDILEPEAELSRKNCGSGLTMHRRKQ